jgi:Glycosyltransferase family 87
MSDPKIYDLQESGPLGSPAEETDQRPDRTVGVSRRRRLLEVGLVLTAWACFVGIVFVREGPQSSGDTVPLTAVTSAVASGELHAAAANDLLPNPPGYPLLVAPLVVLFRSQVGSATWCTSPSRVAALRRDPFLAGKPWMATDVAECGRSVRTHTGAPGPQLPPWYRSQGALGVVSWLIMAIGGLSLLRSTGDLELRRQVGLLVFLAFLPAASSAIVQLYHPQDIVSLGLALAAVAQAIRQRWLLAGALFGAAFLTKQFAILLLVPTLFAAPSNGSRWRLALSAAAVFCLGILPFLLSAPHSTLENLSGFSAGGAQSGATVLSVSGVTGDLASAVARDAPLVFTLLVCVLVERRLGRSLQAPRVLMGLILVCVASRLVFESAIYPYYLLATSVVFFLLDLVARRSPYRSLAWCATAAFFVAVAPSNQVVDALGTLLLALLAVGAGFFELAPQRRVTSALA